MWRYSSISIAKEESLQNQTNAEVLETLPSTCHLLDRSKKWTERTSIDREYKVSNGVQWLISSLLGTFAVSKVSKQNEWIDFCANICVRFARAVFEQITRHIFDQSEHTKEAPGIPSCLFYVRFPYTRQIMAHPDNETIDNAGLKGNKSSKCERH